MSLFKIGAMEGLYSQMLLTNVRRFHRVIGHSLPISPPSLLHLLLGFFLSSNVTSPGDLSTSSWIWSVPWGPEITLHSSFFLSLCREVWSGLALTSPHCVSHSNTRLCPQWSWSPAAGIMSSWTCLWSWRCNSSGTGYMLSCHNN